MMVCLRRLLMEFPSASTTRMSWLLTAADCRGLITAGDDGVFTTSTAANLASLTVSEGALMPGFAPTRTSYAVTVPNATTSLTLTPVAADAAATVPAIASPSRQQGLRRGS